MRAFDSGWDSLIAAASQSRSLPRAAPRFGMLEMDSMRSSAEMALTRAETSFR
jgi:hypothetical protein